MNHTNLPMIDVQGPRKMDENTSRMVVVTQLHYAVVSHCSLNLEGAREWNIPEKVDKKQAPFAALTTACKSTLCKVACSNLRTSESAE